MAKPARAPALRPADQAAHGHGPGPARQRGFVFWAIWVNIATYAIYPTANWLASLRDQRYDFITRWDAMIPLVPEFIFVYFSFFPFLALPFWLVGQPGTAALGKRQVLGTLICGLTFVLFPANLAFERAIPEFEPYRSIFCDHVLCGQAAQSAALAAHRLHGADLPGHLPGAMAAWSLGALSADCAMERGNLRLNHAGASAPCAGCGHCADAGASALPADSPCRCAAAASAHLSRAGLLCRGPFSNPASVLACMQDCSAIFERGAGFVKRGPG